MPAFIFEAVLKLSFTVIRNHKYFHSVVLFAFTFLSSM